MYLKSISGALLLLALTLFLSGCELATRSVVLEGADKTTFYDPPKDKTLATLYLTCGRYLTDGEYNPEPNGVLVCYYAINGINYSMIGGGEVGRIDIPAGKFTVNNSLTHLNTTGLDPSRTLEVKEGEKILLVSDDNHITVITGGLLEVVVKDLTECKKCTKLNNPLTIYKNDFMSQIIAKKPVKVVVRTD
jgi:hypothetical protein